MSTTVLYSTNVSSQVELTTDCSGEYEDDCIYRQLIYRATFALFLMFVVLAGTSACSEKANKGFWPLKFFAPVALFIGFWWGENDFFSGWAEFTRVLSFFWLLVQAFLLFDFAHDLHEVVMQRANDADAESDDSAAKKWKLLYILLCGGFVAATVTGLVFLFQDYADCDLGAFYISVTLVMGVITTAVSLLDVVRKGFLTPMIMFTYSTFMCWYALLSSPKEGCNPSFDENDGDKKETAMGVIIVVTVVVLLYCSYFGTIILNAFSPEGESAMQYGSKASAGAPSPALNDVLTTDTRGEGQADAEGGSFNHAKSVGENPEEESSGTPHERVYFHILMILLVCYCNMILTNWGKANGAPEGYGSDRVGEESMWLKILSQWVFLLLQCRALWVAYQDNE